MYYHNKLPIHHVGGARHWNVGNNMQNTFYAPQSLQTFQTMAWSDSNFAEVLFILFLCYIMTLPANVTTQHQLKFNL